MVFVLVSLTRSIFCERLFTLGKPFDICVLPGLIISMECGWSLLASTDVVITDVAKYVMCSTAIPCPPFSIGGFSFSQGYCRLDRYWL